MKRLMMLVVVLVAGFVFMPVAFAETGDVSVLTDSNTIKEGTPIVTSDDTTTTIRYDYATFKYVEELSSSPAGKRPANNAWIGVNVKYPNPGIKDTFKLKINGEEYDGGYKKEDSYSEWFGVSLKRLNEAIEKYNGVLRYTLEFDWDNDDDVDQTVIIEVNAMTTTLLDMDEEQVWTEDIAAQKYDELFGDDTEESPETADNFYVLLGVLLFGVGSLTYVIKRRFS